MEDYGLALKLLRQYFKLTQREVADRVGVSNHAVSKWENGINQLDIDALRSVCALYSITTEQFFRIASGGSVEEVLEVETPMVSEPPQDASSTGAGMCSTPNSHSFKWWLLLILCIVALLTAGIIALSTGLRGDTAGENNTKESVSAEESAEDENTPVINGPAAYFVGGKESEGSMNPLPIQDGETLTLPACSYTKKGYAFSCWECNGQYYEAGERITVSADKEYIFTARYAPNKFYIHYQSEDYYTIAVTYYYDGDNHLRPYVFDVFSDDIKSRYIVGWIINGVEYGADEFIGNMSAIEGDVIYATAVWSDGGA